jgi:CBS domain-containing protein
MLHVRDFMTTDVMTLDPEMDLREATDTLVQHHVSGAPVVANGRITGVVSATDLLEFSQNTPPVPAAGPEEEGEVAELETPAEWEEGLEAPAAYYVEWWSDAGADVSERFRTVRAPEWDLMAEHTVTEAMTRALCAVRPDATIASAADYMLRVGVHRVLVIDAGKLVGILTTTDFVRAVAQGRLAEAPATPARSPRRRAAAARR